MRIGSLCSGIGGLDLATERHFGGELAWYSEIEPAPSQIMARHWPGVPNLGDLTTVDWSQVEPVDVLTAGYPCQPFSHAGKRKGSKDARHLWPHIIEAVRHLRPRLVVLENVRGHLSLGFDEVLGDLAEAGFDAEWCVLRASDVGAPHQRARLWIVASGERHGGGQVPGAVGRVDRGDAGEARQRERAWEVAGDRSDAAPSDAEGTERGATEHDPVEAPVGRAAEPGERPGEVAWGQYAPAIRRWEACLGRPAPTPTDEGKLSPRFVEWLMGYPEGWVDGLTRTQALKALGNAVVPQQALAALRELAPVLEEAA